MLKARRLRDEQKLETDTPQSWQSFMEERNKQKKKPHLALLFHFKPNVLADKAKMSRNESWCYYLQSSMYLAFHMLTNHTHCHPDSSLTRQMEGRAGERRDKAVCVIKVILCLPCKMPAGSEAFQRGPSEEPAFREEC